MSSVFKLITVRETPIVITAPVYELPKQPEPEKDENTEAAEAAAQLLESVGTETLVEAHQKATEIVETAKKEAEAIVAAATEQGDQLKLDAYDQGYREGFKQGMDQARQAVDEATARAEQIVAEAEVYAAETLKASERQMVDIALAIARKILNHEIAENFNTILPIVTAALGKVRDQDHVNVRVSPEDFPLVDEAKPELQSLLTQDGTLDVTNDPGLKNGDCVVETSFGVIDARIDSQFETVKSSLKEAANE